MGDRRSQRGIAMAFVAVGLMAFLGLTVVAVDIGRIAHTANEVQTVADGAATAAAAALLKGQNAATAAAHATALAGVNQVDGVSAGATIVNVAFGYVDAGGAFQSGAVPSAVKVTAQATVKNLVAGVFGDKTSTVAKDAIGGFVGLGQAKPTLPLAIGNCNFDGISTCFGSSSCLPKSKDAPSSDEHVSYALFSGGTALLPNYLPAKCGGSRTPPSIRVGDTLALSQDTEPAVLSSLYGCIDLGKDEFLVPVVDCNDDLATAATVVGFATIIIDKVTKSSVGPLSAMRTVSGRVLAEEDDAPEEDDEEGLVFDASVGGLGDPRAKKTTTTTLKKKKKTTTTTLKKKKTTTTTLKKTTTTTIKAGTTTTTSTVNSTTTTATSSTTSTTIPPTTGGIDLHVVFRTVVGPPGSCSQCGTGFASLVK